MITLDLGDLLPTAGISQLTPGETEWGDDELQAGRVLQAIWTDPLFQLAAVPQRHSPAVVRVMRPGERAELAEPETLWPGEPGLRVDLTAMVILRHAQEGGELQLDAGAGVLVRQPTAGDALVIPAHVRRGVTEVRKGTRVTIEFDVQSRVRNPEQREILYDIASSLELVRLFAPDRADDGSRLKAIHQKLLRLWIEP